MQKRFAAPLLITAALAGCTAPYEINQPPVSYTATEPLYELGKTSFTVRAVNATEGRSHEMSGIPCRFEGEGFYSTFTVPAVVIAPDMSRRTPPASVTCTFDGRSKTVVVEPRNDTLNEISKSVEAGATAGAVGVIVGGTVAAVQSVTRDESRDVYGYPDVEVVFN